MKHQFTFILIKKLLFSFSLVWLFLPVFAQPSFVGTALETGSYNQVALTDLGAFRQAQLQALSSGSNREWNFIQSSGDFSINWRPYTVGQTLSGYNTVIDPSAQAASARYNSGGGGQPGSLPFVQAGNYYTINITEFAPPTNQFMSILESNWCHNCRPIISVSGTGCISAAGYEVTVTLAFAPAANEYVYVRYSTDGFATSSLVEVNFSGGTSGTATIPDQGAGVGVEYYVYSTNRTLAEIQTEVSNYGELAHDMMTVNLNNNGGSNYTANSCIIVCPGNVTLTTQAEVDAFNCTEITGNLLIQGSGITDLSPLSTLTNVGGYLHISNIGATNVDGLSALSSIGGYLKLFFNSSIANLDGFSSLTSVGDYFSLDGNYSLTNIDGLSALTSVGGYLNLNDNFGLTNYDGLSSLANIGGDLLIHDQSSVLNIDGLSSLTSVGGSIRFSVNNVLTNLDGLSSLTSIGGDINFQENYVLTSIDGLSGLTFLGGNLRIADNYILEEFCGLYALINGGGLTGTYTVINNGTNPTQQQIIDGGPCPQCSISAIAVGSPGPCAGTTYAQDVAVTFTGPPASGTLDVNGQSFTIGTSPQTVTLTNLIADGNPVNVTAEFSSNTGCSKTETALFTAPTPCPPSSQDLQGLGVSPAGYTNNVNGYNVNWTAPTDACYVVELTWGSGTVVDVNTIGSYATGNDVGDPCTTGAAGTWPNQYLLGGLTDETPYWVKVRKRASNCTGVGSSACQGPEVVFPYQELFFTTPGCLCGDGYISACETCDDGNTSPGDGCDPTCQEENGHLDSDGDGYCDNPAECFDFSLPGDCDDNNDAVYPGAPELCDGIDNNCDGNIDEGNTCCPAGNVLFVKVDATGANNGSSWADAFNDLQDALNSTCPGVSQIWVAAGTYYPDEGEGYTENDRTHSFVMKNNLAIYGGFDGTEDPLTFDLNDRDYVANETTLSGDIGATGDNSDNSYHVIFNFNNGLNSTAILDGFTISGGNANSASWPNSYGGGMYNYSSSPALSNCSFSGNSGSSGGGMYNGEYSSPALTNCTFSGNLANNGGGIYNSEYSSPALTNCTFSGNSGYSGGGVYNSSSSPTVDNCSFTGNSGGAMYNYSSSSPTVTNCSFTANTGSAVYNFSGSSPAVTNCTFSGNSSYSGGAIYNNSSSPMVIDCTFSGNTASYKGGGMFNIYGANAVVTNCTFSGNSAPGGGGMFNSNVSSPVMTNCLFLNNTAAQNGGAMLNEDYYGGMTLSAINCTFTGNSASSGSVVYNISTTLTATNCILWGNSGGVIFNDGTSATNFTNSIIEGGYTPCTNCPGGDGNVNPLFISTTDFRLQQCSPAIDAGTNTGAPAYDLDGNVRPYNGGIVDMGAYEYQGNFVPCCPEPSDLIASGITSTTADLGWTENGTATTWEIHLGEMGFDTTGVLPTAVGSNPYTATNLTPDTDYDFYVRSDCGNGDYSDWLGPYSFSTLCNLPDAVCQNINVYLDGAGNATITAADIDGGSSAPCGLQSNSASQSSFTCADIGPNNVTLTVTDVNNASDNCTAIVTVLDTISPTAVCQNVTVFLDGSGNASIVAADLDAGSTDNCGSVTFSASQTAFSCANLGSNNVTLTADDGNGNSKNCTAVVTVADTTSPTAVCQNVTVFLDGAGNSTITASDIDGGSSDNCGSVTLSASQTAFSCANLGPNNVTLTADDGNGNTKNCTAVVTVADTTSPTAVCQNITVYLDGAGNSTITDSDIDGGSSDNCGGVTLFASQTAFTCTNLGPNNVSLTADDGNGNSANCVAVVTVLDTITPLISCPPDILIEICGSDTLLSISPPVVTENCNYTVTNSFNNTDDASGTYPSGLTQVTWTVTDASDNLSSCIQTINLPQVPLPVSYAGEDAAILPSEVHPLSDATAEHYSALIWETSGDGDFDNTSLVNPTYTPGSNDKLAGSVELNLSLEGLNACGFTDSDQMTLTIYRPPSVEITFPFEGDVFYDYSITAEGTAADPDNDLSEVFVNLNGGGWELATGTDIWSHDLILAIGENLIQAKAVDAQGLESDVAEVNVILSIQLIPLEPGWSIISSYLTPNNPALEMVLADVGIPANLTIMLSKEGIFWPEHGINTIGDWNIFEGYKAKHQQADELIMRGDKLNNNDVSFEAGFHIIPVLSNVPAPIDQIFADPELDIEFLFDINTGLIYWPQGGILDLIELIPGRGYLAKFKKAVSIDFPDYQNLKAGLIQATPITQNNGPWDYSRTGNVHQVSVTHDAAADLKNATHVGVFDVSGRCVGSVEINQSNGNYLLTVFGDDETTSAKDGALEDELLTFKAYNPQQNLEIEIKPDFSQQMPDYAGQYKTNGMSMITGFKETSTAIGGPAANGLQIELFPNPARDVVTLICPDYSEDEQLEAEFVNAGGKVAKRIQLSGKSTNIDLNELNPGVYFVKITSQSGTVIKKLVIQ